MAQPQRATVFTLSQGTVGSTAQTVHNFLNTHSPFLPTIPSVGELTQFFAIPFNNRLYHYAPNFVPVPGISLTEQSGKLHFDFGNIANTNTSILLVGAMDYLNGNPTFISAQGPEVFNGISYYNGVIQYHIYMVGTLSTNCPAGVNQCYGDLEIIIVDKNIL